MIRLGHLSTLYHTSMLLLARKDLLGGFPAEIEWHLFGTGPAIIESFKRGELDLAYIGLPPAVSGISGGLRIKCVAGGHVEGSVIAGRSDFLGFPETEDLGGILSEAKRIGVPGKGSIHDIIIVDALRKHGILAKIHNLAWADRVLEEFVKGMVDAVIGTPALAQAVITYGNGRLLYPPHLLWPDNPSYGIVVREDFLEKSPDLVRDFLRVHETATQILRGEPERAAWEIADLLRIVDSEFVADTLAISPRYCAALTPAYVECTMKLAKRQYELGYLERQVSVEEIFEMSLIRDIHPEPAHYYPGQQTEVEREQKFSEKF